jgi:cyclopropane-fatty-acyl-phospholipid synthase
MISGGYLPPGSCLLASIEQGQKGKLEVESAENIGPHYVETLRLWREKFEETWLIIRDDYTKTHSLDHIQVEPYVTLTNNFADHKHTICLYSEAGH